MKQLEKVGTGYRYVLQGIDDGICYYARTVQVPVSAFLGRKPPSSIAVAIAKKVPRKKRR